MRDRKKKAPAPAPVPSAPPAAVPSEELAALRARLDAVERASVPKSPWSQMRDRHALTRERELAALSRVSPDSPCAACGDAMSPQRRLLAPELLGRSGWLCACCVEAVCPGWGTQSTKLLPRGAMLDRLASLAAGQEVSTQGFAVLAARYGLVFTLAQDAPGKGTGEPWSHLGNRAEWRRVGALATRRAAAGFGVLPCVSPDRLRAGPMTMGRVLDRDHPRGWRMAPMEAQSETPVRDEAAALKAEERAVDEALKAQARQAKEAEDAAARIAERAHINREYRAAVRAQDQLFEAERRKLNSLRRSVHRAADTKADFNAIVRGA